MTGKRAYGGDHTKMFAGDSLHDAAMDLIRARQYQHDMQAAQSKKSLAVVPYALPSQYRTIGKNASLPDNPFAAEQAAQLRVENDIGTQ